MSLRRSISFPALLFVLHAVFAPAALSQQQFRVAGVVVDSVSGAPIERAEVTIAPATDSEKTTATLSASNGAFAFSGLAPGKYRLTAGRVGYTIQGLDQHESFMTAVAVGSKHDSEHIHFRLVRESVISGVVFDEFGEPVRDAEMFLFERRLASGLRTPQLAGRATTNDIGEYRFPHLAPGAYMVVVHAKPWYGNDSQHGYVIRMGSMTIRSDNEFRRTRFVSRLSTPDSSDTETSDDQSDDPVQDATVITKAPPDKAQLPSDPRRDVVYPLSFYSNADSLDSATPLVLSPGSTVSADFFLHPVPSLKLLVKVPDSSAERAQGGIDKDGITTETLQRAGGISASLELGGQSIENLPVQRSPRFPGYFEISGAAPGELALSSTPQSRTGLGENSVRKQVSSDGTIDLSAANMASVSGFTDGVPVGMTLLREGSSVGAIGVLFISTDRKTIYGAAMNQKGEFELSIPPGTYSVELHPSEIFHAASVQSTGAPLSGHAISLSPGANARLTIHGVQANCTVNGTALKNGKPFAGAMLILVPEDPTQSASLFHRDQSDSDGTFTMSPVLPGRYTLLALENGWDLEWSSLSVLFPYLPAGVPLDLKPSSSISATVKVQ